MIGSRFSKCSFYKPEYEAVLRRFTQLKKANTPLALSAYMKERKAFVRQSFEVSDRSSRSHDEIADFHKVWP